MQSYLYRNDERIKSIYAQIIQGIVAKKTVEKSETLEGSISGGILSLLTSSLKGAKGGKTTTETLTAPENMVTALVKIIPETGPTKRLVEPVHWAAIAQGDLVVFRGELEFDSYGLTKDALWKASYEDIGQRKTRHDLRLKGLLAGRMAEIPFSSNWVTGPSQFTVLCHAMFEFLEGLAIVVNCPNANPVLMQPLAFGNGFVTRTQRTG